MPVFLRLGSGFYRFPEKDDFQDRFPWRGWSPEVGVDLVFTDSDIDLIFRIGNETVTDDSVFRVLIHIDETTTVYQDKPHRLL